MEGEFDDGAARRRVDELELVDRDDPVVEFDAGLEPGARILGDLPLDLREVGLGDLVAGMGEAVGQLPVVGEQDEALGVGVEASDVEDPLGAVADVVAEVLAPLGVLHRRDDPGGLVEREVDLLRARRDPQGVDVDRLGLRIDAGAELGDDVPVDLDPSVEDELLARATGPQPRLGEDLLQAHSPADVGVRGLSRAGGGLLRARTLLSARTVAAPAGRPGIAVGTHGDHCLKSIVLW
ncbi:Uncharacterised protein [Mycobacteroides abscessus subsp. abscessus]|nr:Uncharacterised protein [Mycobacteroides abscessus subsp. abscessus]